AGWHQPGEADADIPGLPFGSDSHPHDGVERRGQATGPGRRRDRMDHQALRSRAAAGRGRRRPARAGAPVSEDIRRMFFVEAADLVRHFEQGVLRLEHGPTDRETLDRIFRGAHTLKGLSGMLRYDRIARFTHGLEDFLTRLRKGDLAVTAAVTDKLLAAADAPGTPVREAGGAGLTNADDPAESDRLP